MGERKGCVQERHVGIFSVGNECWCAWSQLGKELLCFIVCAIVMALNKTW